MIRIANEVRVETNKSDWSIVTSQLCFWWLKTKLHPSIPQRREHIIDHNTRKLLPWVVTKVSNSQFMIYLSKVHSQFAQPSCLRVLFYAAKKARARSSSKRSTDAMQCRKWTTLNEEKKIKRITWMQSTNLVLSPHLSVLRTQALYVSCAKYPLLTPPLPKIPLPLINSSSKKTSKGIYFHITYVQEVNP